MNTSEIKAEISVEVDALRPRLAQLARQIHDTPETGFNETLAAGWLTAFLESAGFSVETGVCGLPTAFRASYGDGPPNLALIAEYDALPGAGHACGHNVSCAISVGAAVAARLAVDRFRDRGHSHGRISVIGTPGEEMLGGKIMMADRGGFEGLDAAMMVHSGTADFATTSALACRNLEVEFFGRAAHAAARPEQGINALEALLQSFSAINSLRQHIRDSARIHGIITDGGQVPNVVPDHSAGKFIVRAAEKEYLDELQERVLNCFQGAATASGARLEYRWDPLCYAPMQGNTVLARLYAANIGSLGRDIRLVDDSRTFGSTDMGNVSQLVPAIHATIAIAPENVLLHSPEFAVAATSEAAVNGLIDAAKALAMTVTDLLATPETMAEVRNEFGGGQ